MAPWPGEDHQQNLSSFYDKPIKDASDDDDDNLWASLLNGERRIILERFNYSMFLEVAATKHSSLPSKNLLVLGNYNLLSS